MFKFSQKKKKKKMKKERSTVSVSVLLNLLTLRKILIFFFSFFIVDMNFYFHFLLLATLDENNQQSELEQQKTVCKFLECFFFSLQYFKADQNGSIRYKKRRESLHRCINIMYCKS